MSERDIFGRLADHLKALQERLDTLQYEVFQNPPKTMEEFTHRRGVWEELSDEIKDLHRVVYGKEE